jgi:cell division protein ZapA
MGRSVEVRVGGQKYRVVSSADERRIHQLAAVVDARLAELVPSGKMVQVQSLLLVALALAHDLDEERGRRQRLEGRTREMLSELLGAIDEALRAPNSGVPAGKPGDGSGARGETG